VTVRSGLEALAVLREQRFDIVVSDVMMPDMDGFELVRAIRDDPALATIPFIMLSARAGEGAAIDGLTRGADDYLVKPFAFSELAARVAALGRRPRRAAQETRLRVADLEMDLLSRSVRRGALEIDLQPREFRLLEFLMRHANQVVTRTMLLEKVWDLNFDPHTNVVESHISRLRQKIDRGPGSALIHTVRGAGYCLRVAA
jgi:two-component system OmpR family response regulator